MINLVNFKIDGHGVEVYDGTRVAISAADPDEPIIMDAGQLLDALSMALQIQRPQEDDGTGGDRDTNTSLQFTG